MLRTHRSAVIASVANPAIGATAGPGPCQHWNVGEWAFTDAWLLAAAAGFGRRGCSLSELLGAADAMNHDTPRADQASISLGRLCASGLITRAHGRICATRQARDLYKRRARGLFEQSASVLELLREVELIEGEWNFGPEEFDDALEIRRKRVAKWTR